MEIRVEERLTGEALRDRILSRYGSRQALEEQANQEADRDEAEGGPDPAAADAQADLATLRTLEEDPDRLEARMRVARTALLEAEDLAKLTPARLQLLPVLAENREAGRNITELADHLDRDKKNVSEDVEVLQHLGLADARREGRSKIPFLPDAEIAIRIDPTGDVGDAADPGDGTAARAG